MRGGLATETSTVGWAGPAAAELLGVAEWRQRVLDRVTGGARVVALFGREDGGAARITAVLEEGTGSSSTETLTVLRTRVDPAVGYPALSADVLAFHLFERELHEQLGVRLPGHPWLKPVRWEGGRGQVEMNAYPWYRIEGKDVHEVAVGPIHAGVIEPGSFRFLCHGEEVLHLELHLGYQHRGAERLLLARDPRRLAPLVETIAGDSSIAHAWAYAAAVERLTGAASEDDLSRAVLLELERVGLHLATLSGLAADIGFLQGATSYGRLRTTVINTTMKLCGSRFGRTGVRPGGAGYAFGPAQRELVGAALGVLDEGLAGIDARFFGDRGVRARLRGVGRVTPERARELGLVGVSGRASGLPGDQRRVGVYAGWEASVEADGDCHARAKVRAREMAVSLRWLQGVVDGGATWEARRAGLPTLAPGRLAVTMVEGPRGEVVHALETDEEGALIHYKVQDPSLRCWPGLAWAVRGQDISDFPICNKSFDLSYCGSDL